MMYNQNKMSSSENKKIGDYIIGELLGKGAFAQVFKAREKNTGKIFAVKKIDKSAIDRQPILKRLLQTELQVMHNIKHPNILHLHKYFQTNEHLYLVLDFCNKSDLEKVLKNTPGRCFDEHTAVGYLKQIMNGFQELRKNKILHRDFKLANIFMNDERIIIGDFGFAKYGQEIAQTRLGTPLTMAPELLMSAGGQNCQYNSKADLWSIGVVFYEMLLGNHPFFGDSEAKIISKIKQHSGTCLPFPKQVSEESKDLLRRLLTIDPVARISWDAFFAHPVFDKFQYNYDKKKKLNQFGQVVLSDQSQINFEFNRHKKDGAGNLQVELDPTKIATQGDYLPVPVQEENVDANSAEQVLYDIKTRYNHEKNKFVFIFYTCRRVEEFAKIPGLKYELAYYLQHMQLLLLKKFLVLNYTMIINTSNGINCFDFPQPFFQQFLHSAYYPEITQVFYNDHQSTEQWFNNGLNNPALNTASVPVLRQSNPSVQQLNQLLDECYLQVKSYAHAVSPNFERDFYTLMMCVSCCTSLDSSFPYIHDGNKFPWDQFYKTLTSVAVDELKKMIR